MSNLKVLVADRDIRDAEVEDLLRDALGMGYERVLVVGIKDGDVHTNTSKQFSMAETLGYLEILKNEMFSNW